MTYSKYCVWEYTMACQAGLGKVADLRGLTSDQLLAIIAGDTDKLKIANLAAAGI